MEGLASLAVSNTTRQPQVEDWLMPIPPVDGLPLWELERSHRTSLAARTREIAWGAQAVLSELKPRLRRSEDEIVLAAITVILVALLTIMVLAAAAVLTMGWQ
jgi:hypothetical protein